MMIRFKSRCGQADDPNFPELKGKWFFEILMGFLGSGEFRSMGHFGPFDTKEAARKESWKAVKMCCDEYGKTMFDNPNIESTHYVDMKTNERRRWDRKDEM